MIHTIICLYTYVSVYIHTVPTPTTTLMIPTSELLYEGTLQTMTCNVTLRHVMSHYQIQ